MVWIMPKGESVFLYSPKCPWIHFCVQFCRMCPPNTSAFSWANTIFVVSAKFSAELLYETHRSFVSTSLLIGFLSHISFYHASQHQKYFQTQVSSTYDYRKHTTLLFSSRYPHGGHLGILCEFSKLRFRHLSQMALQALSYSRRDRASNSTFPDRLRAARTAHRRLTRHLIVECHLTQRFKEVPISVSKHLFYLFYILYKL